MRDFSLFDPPCECRNMGVRIQSGWFEFCTCEAGRREREHDTGGFAALIGRVAAEAVERLSNQLEEELA